MGRIVSNFFISLDGVVERPDQWHFPYFDDEMGAIIGQGMSRCSGFLMGRRLYDEWSEFWPQQGPEVPFSAHINAIPKYVITSRPVEGALWNGTTVLGADPVAELRDLKDGTDGDIALSGCATTVRWLLANDLLDELDVLLHPIAVGRGQRLFEGTPTTPLALLASRALASGVLHLRYAPASRTS